MRYDARNPPASATAAAAGMICTRTGRAAPSGGGGSYGSSRYACTTMLPLLTDESPAHTTVPLALFGGSTPRANVTLSPCDAAKYAVDAFASSPSWLGTVQVWPLRWTTTTWYLPAGIRGSDERSAASARGSTRTSIDSRAIGGAPAARLT